MPNRTPTWLAAASLLIFSLSYSSQQHRLSFEERMERYISSFPEHQEFQGVILVAHKGKIIFHKGYGLANREFDIPAGPNTKFQVGSITKAFTAILALKMAEIGLLRLDAPICDYLLHYPAETGRKITPRQLLSHTSGIPHHIDALPDFWISHDKIFHSPQNSGSSLPLSLWRTNPASNSLTAAPASMFWAPCCSRWPRDLTPNCSGSISLARWA